MEKVKKNDIVTTLSIYSSRVSTCVAILDKDNCPSVIGLGKADGKLLGEKGVLDIDGLTKAIRDSLRLAQEEADIESPKAFVGISGCSLNSEKSRGIVKLNHRGEEISDKNVREVLKVANAVPINFDREIIHSIPQEFIVDGQGSIRNPVGLYGVKLEVESLLITAYLPFLQNIIKALNLAGVELEDFVFSGVAASQCLLSQETEGKGVILIEIDNHFTALSVFFDNLLRGVYIQPKSVIADGVLEVLKEKLDVIRSNKPISKIILAGGGYIHEDFIEKVDTVFGIPSQMAYPNNLKGTAKNINDPAYLASIGVAYYGLAKKKEDMNRKRSLNTLAKIYKQVTTFFNDYF
jgi:cell division ATPase FtsA